MRAELGDGVFHRPCRIALACVALALLLGCRGGFFADPASTRLWRCERRPIPAFPVGANVVDLPDDKDDDPKNDGLRGFGSDKARSILERLAALGLDGVVLPVPVYADGRSATHVRPGSLAEGQGLVRLARMIDDAHARSLFVVVVPHLLLDDGSWRGDLEPALEASSPTEAAARFFEAYGDAILPLARVAEKRCAEAFSVAVELKSLSQREETDAAWQRLVLRVRAAFSGEVLYSANWDEVASARVWPLFDRIGVNAFHPLADAPGASDEALQEAARAVQRALAGIKAREGEKPLWFVEVGFKAVPEPHVKPWLWPKEVGAALLPVDEAAQARAYRAVIQAFYAVPAVDGAFFWVVPTDPDDLEHPWRFEPEQGFSFLDKEAEAFVRKLAENPPRRPEVSPVKAYVIR